MLSPRRALRRRLKRLSFALFLLLDRLGIHLLPKHYSAPVADRAWLRKNPSLWQRPAPLAGIDWNLDDQLAWLDGIAGPYYDEVAGLSRYSELVSDALGPGYGPVESQVLHCFVRAAAPDRVVEVGGGVSTAIIASAAAMNAEEGRSLTKIVTVEPFPAPALASMPGVELVREPAQAVEPALFGKLRQGDLLFIDSTHTVKTGSELMRLYLEIVPALPAGIVIHVHDIYLPYLYAPDVLSSYLDWHETSLLLALLTGNERLRVLCCLSALHHDRPDSLRRVLTDYRPRPDRRGLAEEHAQDHFPSSLWLETA